MSRFSTLFSLPVALVGIGLLTGGALAAGNQPAAPAAPAAAVNCDTAESDADLLVCAKRDLAQGETQLAALTKRIEGSLPATAKPLFSQAQKAWTAYRDADCAWNAYDLESGKSIELVQMTCLADLTASRVEELEAGLGAQ